MRALVWPVGAAALGVAVRVLRRRWVVATVVGTSMLPAFEPGERLLVSRSPAVLRLGDVVVVVAPDSAGVAADERLLVKRVAGLPGDPLPGRPAAAVPRDTLVVLGDNGGYDSRWFGPLARDRVVGVVLRRLPRPGAGRSCR